MGDKGVGWWGIWRKRGLEGWREGERGCVLLEGEVYYEWVGVVRGWIDSAYYE